MSDKIHFEPDEAIQSISAERAREFFGFPPETRVEDGGPPPRPERYKPEARVWLLYPNDPPQSGSRRRS